MPARTRLTPRKTPQQGRSKDTVNAILDATARVLVREGYAAASTNRVALAAGVSVGSLYQYFPNKDALISALLARHRAQMLAVFTEKTAAYASAPLPIAVREVVEAMVAAHRVDPRLHRVLLEQAPRSNASGALAACEQAVASLFRQHLEARRSELRPRDLELAVFLLMTMVEAATHAAVLDRPELLQSGAFVDEVTTLVLGYLCA